MVTVISNAVRCWRLDTVTGGCNYGAGPRRRYQLLYQGHYVSSDGPPPATLTVTTATMQGQGDKHHQLRYWRLRLKMVRRKCRLHLNVQKMR